jgi:hypothetical protein
MVTCLVVIMGQARLLRRAIPLEEVRESRSLHSLGEWGRAQFRAGSQRWFAQCDRMVLEQADDWDSKRAAILSIAEKRGFASETLRSGVVTSECTGALNIRIGLTRVFLAR